MAESIGNLYSTKIPLLSDTADIQEALRIYHYGAPSGTGVGQYDPTNSNTANLVNPSIAYTLNSLQSQITSISGTLGVQASTWSAKGVLVTATAPSTVSALTVGTNGQVLTADSTAGTGLRWITPEVTLANTATLTNKTLTGPKISSASFIGDSNGNELILFPATIASAVNEITVSNAITTGKPTISATGNDTNITLNLVSKGTGTVQVNGIDIVSLSSTQTLTNKTLTAPTVTQLYLSDSVVVFEGATADAFETTLTVVDPTVDRTISLPNVDGTVITTGNLTSITSVGTVTSGTFPAANLSGTALPATVVSSSLTSVGTITSGSFPAANISGTTLASNIVSSSLTSFGASPTINTPTMTLATASSTTDARISWDTTNKKIQVGNGTVALDFASSTISGAGTAVTLTTNNYNLILTDKDKMIEINNTVASTVTIPLNSSQAYPIGTQIVIVQTGSGQVTISVAAGVTLNCTPQGTANTAKLRTQWSSATIVKRNTDTWLAMGDLVA